MTPETRDHIRHLDGLRAVAVLLVVFFHLDIAHLPGGFVGVDVFFVISGYLITNQIIFEVQEQRFRLSSFYTRRIRRIGPALLATVLLTSFAGIVLLSPDRLYELGKSVPYALFSVSNFYFWAQSGYFDGDAVTKPLLHTWSLGVEVQFYLLWPLIVLLAIRAKLERYGIIIIGLVSIVCAQWYLSTDAVASFYLMPFRLGEFVIGASIAVMRLDRIQVKPGLADGLALSGMAAIAVSAVLFSSATGFPGVAALVPCVGAGLVVCFGGAGRVTMSLLNNTFAVATGKLSYSLYLVHWPIIVIYKRAPRITRGFR